jgi:hypothetical protein
MGQLYSPKQWIKTSWRQSDAQNTVACRWLFYKDQTLLVMNSLGISCAQNQHIGKWLVVPGINYTWKITYIPYPMSEKGRGRIQISDFP